MLKCNLFDLTVPIVLKHAIYEARGDFRRTFSRFRD